MLLKCSLAPVLGLETVPFLRSTPGDLVALGDLGTVLEARVLVPGTFPRDFAVVLGDLGAVPAAAERDLFPAPGMFPRVLAVVLGDLGAFAAFLSGDLESDRS